MNDIPGGPVPPPPPGPPRFYRHLYGDPNNGVGAGLNLRKYLAGYRFNEGEGGAAAPTPATLYDQTVPMCDRQPADGFPLSHRTWGERGG